MVGRARPSAAGYVLGVAVGLTWATNALGGGTLWCSLVVAVVACGYGWRHRRDLPVVLLTGFAPAVVVLGVAAAV
jgi:hypothetical protein